MATCPTCGQPMLTEQPHACPRFRRAPLPSHLSPLPPGIWDDLGERITRCADSRRDDSLTAKMGRAPTPPIYDESPLRWERPHIVSTSASTAAGTPKPNGWEA